MHIKIKVATEQYGTELGELCEPQYCYECTEFDPSVVNHEYTYSHEKIITFQIDDTHHNLKPQFLITLQDYLNENHLQYQPGEFNSVSFKEIADDLRIKMIKRSNEFPIAAAIGFFERIYGLNKDVSGLIHEQLSQQDCLNLASTTKETREEAVKNTLSI